MTFSSERPANFDTIEIEVVRQPGGGTIDVRLDGVVETTYDLKSSKAEPVVIRLTPARALSITLTLHARDPHRALRRPAS